MTSAPETHRAELDRTLVDRCRQGDEDAWRQVVERYSRYVAAIARAYGLSDTDAEDVFQESFMRTWRNLERLRGDDALRPWLGQVARRLCLDCLRSSKRTSADSELVEALEEPGPDAFAQLELALDVRNALATLNADCQAVLDAFFCRDRSYVEISQELGIPSGTIASRISRCLGKLREHFASNAT